MRLGKHFRKQKDLRMPKYAAVPQTAEMRRQRSTLAISGAGVIVFFIWDFIKSRLSTSVNTSEMDSAEVDEVLARLNLTSETVEIDEQFLVLIALVVFFVLIGLLFLRIYAGRAALAESRGERRSSLYIVAAGVTLVFNTIASVLGFVLFGQLYNIEDLIVTCVVDATSAVMLIDLIVSALKLRKLTKQASETEA